MTPEDLETLRQNTAAMKELAESNRQLAQATIIGAAEALTMAQAEIYCDTSRGTLTEAVNKGELLRAKHEKKVFFDKKHLDNWKMARMPSMRK